MGRCRNVILVETTLRARPGSMAIYADLVELAVGAQNVMPLSVKRANLAYSGKLPRLLPTKIQNAVGLVAMSLKAKRLAKRKTDLFHLIDGSHAHVLAWLKHRSPVVCTSHDVIPYLQSTGRFDVPAPGPAARWLIQRSLEGLRGATLIASVSSSTAEDLAAAGIKRETIKVVRSALPHNMAEAAKRFPCPEWEKRRWAEKPFVLHVGNNGFYKNREGVLRIFALFGPEFDLHLRLAGPAPGSELLGLANELGLHERIEFVVDPDSDRLANLYCDACLFLFPSLYEGFGWPPLEAMSFGCPVVCSDAGSLWEVAGPAALTASPTEHEVLSAHCRRVLSSPGLAADLIGRGRRRASEFSLERMGLEIARIYLEALENR